MPPDAIASAQDEFGDRYIETRSRRRSPTSASRPTTSATPTRASVRPSRWPSTARRSPRRSSRAAARRPTRSSPRSSTATARTPASTASWTSTTANELLDEAGFDRSQPIELWFNAGAGHDAWMEAVGNQLRDNLGVEYTLQGDLDFAEYLPLRDAKGMTGPFRLGWSMDYPSPRELPRAAVHHRGARRRPARTRRFYSNPEFDELVAQGNRPTATRTPSRCTRQAEDLLAGGHADGADVLRPGAVGALGERVATSSIDIFGRIDVAAVTVNG